MNIQELRSLTHECAKKINDILGKDIQGNYPVNMDNITGIKYNGRLKNTLGRARLNRFKGTFDIEYSRNYFTFDGTPLESKTSVVYHEIIHTIQGCFNHGDTFNRVCRRIERHTGITDIAGARKKETSGYRKSNSKYKIACTVCDVEGFRHKTMIKGQQEGIVPRYSCRCGGSLEQSLNR
jgi:hypothetical protein